MIKFVIGITLMFLMGIIMVVQEKNNCPETELLVTSLSNAQNSLTKINENIAKNILEQEKQLAKTIAEYEAKKKSLQCPAK